MSLLGASQLRFITRTPWSTLTVLLGMTLGVASVVAVHQISLRVTDSLQAATPPHLAGLSHLLEVATGPTTADDYFDLRARWRDGQLPEVRGLLPIVEGQLVLDGHRTQVFATDWLAAGVMPARALQRDGVVPAWDGIVADASLGLVVGEAVTINGADYPVAAVVDGGMGPAVFADIGAGQAMLGIDSNTLSYVGAIRADSLRRLKDAVAIMLPGASAGFAGPSASWAVAGWRVRGVASEQPTLAFARSVIFNLGALGSLALVVAWFLIYQVGVIWHRRRRTLMDRLFAMGVTRRELIRGFVSTFAVLGIVATVLGVVAGTLLARILSEVSTAGLDVPGSLPGLTGPVLVKAGISGVGVSALGGWMACRREWSWAGHPTNLGRAGWLLPMGLCALLLAGIAVPASGLLGGFAAVLAVSLLVVLCVRPLLEHLRAMSGRLRGRLLTRIGLREVSWYPRDLSIAIGALSLAVATSMGVGLMVDSFREDFVSMLDQRLAHDLFVDGAGQDLAPLRDWLADQPDARAVQAYGHSRERLQQLPVELGYTKFSARESLRYGMRRALALDEVMISERVARALSLDVGDALAVRGRTLQIVAVFRGFGDAGYRLLVDDATARRLGVALIYDRLGISRDPATLTGPAAGTELGSRLLSRFGDTFPSLRVQPRDNMRRLALEIFDRTFAITTALTLLALLVAVIGMYNALLALRLNQAPSYRLLNALGVSAREQRMLALGRAGAVGCIAVLLALPLGIVMAWLLCEVINPRAFGWSLQLRLGADTLLIPLGLGLLAALLAGFLPMPRQGESSVAEA